jgi:tetratricopeptide (TPR) repeat protein
LPDEIEHQTQPSKAAAYALLSNVYLSMRNYPLALENATNSLDVYNNLLDYNTLPPAIPYGDPVFGQYTNPEVLFHHRRESSIGYLDARGIVNIDLYNSYDSDDLRPDIFFSDAAGNGYQMWENYGGNYYEFFDGLAVDEMYLTRAECYARSGNIDLALNDLNDLLEKRYATDAFVPYNSVDFTTVTATQLVLQERRKELIFRGIRWSDIRRLNKENDPNYAVGPLVRTFEGSTETITLPVNDLRYAFLIPQESIDKSGLKQNPR